MDSLLFNPGERYTYSNPAYNGLALIIDQVTQAPWQDFIYKTILEPSGMKSTTIQDGAYPITGVAHGYVQIDGGYQEQDYGEEPTFAASGNSGIWSSVLELAAYENAIENNLFLNQELTRQSRTVWKPENWKAKNDPFLGYSWFVEKDAFFGIPDFEDATFVYHTGSNGGYHSFYIRIPEKDVLLIGLFNQPLKEYRKTLLKTLSILKEENWGVQK